MIGGQEDKQGGEGVGYCCVHRESMHAPRASMRSDAGVLAGQGRAGQGKQEGGQRLALGGSKKTAGLADFAGLRLTERAASGARSLSTRPWGMGNGEKLRRRRETGHTWPAG